MDELAFDVVFEPIDISDCQPVVEVTSPPSVPHSPPADGKDHRPHRQVDAPVEVVATVSPRSVRPHAAPQQPHQPTQSPSDSLSMSTRANVAFGKSTRVVSRPAPHHGHDLEKARNPTVEEVQHEIAEDELRIAKMRQQYPAPEEQQSSKHMQPPRTEVAPCSFLGSEDVSSSFYLMKVAQDIKVQPHDLMTSSRNIMEGHPQVGNSSAVASRDNTAGDSSPLILIQEHSSSVCLQSGMAPVPSFTQSRGGGASLSPRHSNISPHASITACAPTVLRGSFVGGNNSNTPLNSSSATARHVGKKSKGGARGKRRGTQQGGAVACTITPPDDRDSLDDDDDVDFFHEYEDAQEGPFLKANSAPLDLAAWSFLDGMSTNALSVLSGGEPEHTAPHDDGNEEEEAADSSKGDDSSDSLVESGDPVVGGSQPLSASVSSIPVREVLLLRHGGGDSSTANGGARKSASSHQSPSSTVSPHPPISPSHNVCHAQISARNNSPRSPQSSCIGATPKSPDVRPLPRFTANASMTLTTFPVIDTRLESQSLPSGGEKEITPESSMRSLLSGDGGEGHGRLRRGSAQVSPGMVSLHASTSSLLHVSPQNNHSGTRPSRVEASLLLDSDASVSQHHFHVVRGAPAPVPSVEAQQLHQQHQDEAATITHALHDHLYSSQKAARSSVLVIQPTTLVGAHRKSTIRIYEEDEVNESCVV